MAIDSGYDGKGLAFTQKVKQGSNVQSLSSQKA